jgi:hypothetical protein
VIVKGSLEYQLVVERVFVLALTVASKMEDRALGLIRNNVLLLPF